MQNVLQFQVQIFITLLQKTNFRDKLPFVNSTKSLTFDLTKIVLPKLLILIYCLIEKVVHYQMLFNMELKSSY